MRNIWLASYPKSGNTWFRIMLANLASAGAPVDINDLPKRNSIASAREPFDHFTLLDSSLMSNDEIDALRPRVHAHLARTPLDEDEDAPAAPVHFIKTHDAYTRTAAGDALLGGTGAADGAIILVRDPRDVAPSVANHKGVSLDEAIAFMNDPAATLCGKPDRLQLQLRQQLPGWSGHVESWLSQRDLPVHLVRYEDMKADAAATLSEALAFARYDASPDAIDRAVRLADFAALQMQERESGFREAPRPHRGGIFFRRGEAGGWRDELTADQVARIEGEHAPMMRRLGYAPVSALSRTG